MRNATLILSVILALAASAVAQNKLSLAEKCAKPDKEYKIDVGDRAGHIFDIAQGKCSYTKGEVEGIQIKEEMWTDLIEINGDAAHGRFSNVLTMANGDKVYGHGEFKQVWKGGVVQTEEGSWSWSGGTGKFKNLKGKGIYHANIAADGTAMVAGDGEYTLPAVKK